MYLLSENENCIVGSFYRGECLAGHEASIFLTLAKYLKVEYMVTPTLP